MTERSSITSSDVETIPHYEDSVLAARGVVTGYGKAEIIHGVDLDVRSDEIVLIFGPNGAGKSTIMKALYSILPIWGGSIHIKGTNVGDIPTEQMVEHDICYVPQRDNTFPNLSAKENLEMGGVTVDDKTKRINEIYDLFPKLEELATREARSLSGGESQMLAMGRALMVDPDVLLIDEPSAGLAPQLVTEVLGHIERINETGTAVLLIEQNVEAGLQITDRGYAFEMGENRFEGTPDQLLNHDRIQDLYLGTEN